MESNKLVLSSLIRSPDYFTKVVGYMKPEYFESEQEKLVLSTVLSLYDKYSVKPDTLAITNTISESRLPANTIESTVNLVNELCQVPVVSSYDYLIDTTEKYLRERAIFNALSLSLEVYDNTNKQYTVSDLPDILSAAINISLREDESHDYFNDAEARWDAYMQGDSKVGFEFDCLNAITNGGVTRKSLNLIAAGVNVGKTLMLIILATMYVRMGYNVLYVTNEVNQIDLCKRIDASNIGVESDMLLMMAKNKFLQKIAALQKTHGRLFVHEFGTGECTANKVKSLCKNYRTKFGVQVDVIINDYITICAPNSVNSLITSNMGIFYKTVAENWRALAFSENAIVWSAAQLKTEAMNSTDPELSDLGASQGIAQTADCVWAVIRTESLDNSLQIGFKQLKTRYHHTKIVRWTMGINVAKHRLSEISNTVIEHGITERWNTMKEHLLAKKVQTNDVSENNTQVATIISNNLPLVDLTQLPENKNTLAEAEKAKREEEERLLFDLLGT